MQGWIFQPGERVERSFHASDFTQGKGKAVLTRIRAEFAQDERSGYGPLLDRSGQPQHFAELLLDESCIDGAADQRSEGPPLTPLAGNVQPFVGEIADAGSEAKAQQMAESEDMVGEAAGVGVVLFDPQVGLMVEQPVKDVGRIANCGVDNFGMKGRVLIGDNACRK